MARLSPDFALTLMPGVLSVPLAERVICLVLRSSITTSASVVSNWLAVCAQKSCRRRRSRDRITPIAARVSRYLPLCFPCESTLR